jgi:hypothetical protein
MKNEYSKSKQDKASWIEETPLAAMKYPFLEDCHLKNSPNNFAKFIRPAN